MTDQSHHVTESNVTPVLMAPPTIARLVRDQRKTILVAAVLMVGCYWVMGQLGQWTTATLTAVGILLALLNHLVTEFWLARVIASGRQPTREKMIVSTLVRLLVVAMVAVGLAVAYWPSGIGLLLGLALFRLIALVMTGIPLLKELKSQ